MPNTSTISHRLSIVVPMYNEQENAVLQLNDIQDALQDYPMPWEAIVVDDGSSDDTAARLKQRALELGSHFRILELRRNFKQTAAMQAGIDAARGDVIVTMDGDLQNEPRDIPKLVQRLLNEDLDMVAGWRQKRQDGFWLRRFPSLIANHLIRKVSGLDFKDLGCSLKAFRADVLKQIKLYGEMHRFIPAWLATVTSPRRMAEEPVRHHARRLGESKYGISRTFRVIIDLLAMYFFLRFGTRPGHFFGGIGLGFSAIGSAVLGYLGLIKLFGADVAGRPLLWLGFFFFIAGVQLLTTGVLAEILMRSYFDSTAVKSYQLMHTQSVADNDSWHSGPRKI